MATTGRPTRGGHVHRARVVRHKRVDSVRSTPTSRADARAARQVDDTRGTRPGACARSHDSIARAAGRSCAAPNDETRRVALAHEPRGELGDPIRRPLLRLPVGGARREADHRRRPPARGVGRAARRASRASPATPRRAAAARHRDAETADERAEIVGVMADLARATAALRRVRRHRGPMSRIPSAPERRRAASSTRTETNSGRGCRGRSAPP